MIKFKTYDEAIAYANHASKVVNQESDDSVFAAQPDPVAIEEQ